MHVSHLLRGDEPRRGLGLGLGCPFKWCKYIHEEEEEEEQAVDAVRPR